MVLAVAAEHSTDQEEVVFEGVEPEPEGVEHGLEGAEPVFVEAELESEEAVAWKEAALLLVAGGSLER